MKQLFLKLRHSVLARTIGVLILTLLVLIVAGTAISAWNRSVLTEQIVALNSSQTAAGMKQLTSEIERLALLESEMLFDTDINRLGVMPGYYSASQKTQAILRVEKRLLMLANSSSLFYETLLFCPAIDRMVTSTGMENIDEAFYGEISEACIKRDRQLTRIGGSWYLVMPYPTYSVYLKEYGPMYILAARLNEEAMRAYLNSLTSKEDEYAALISLRDGVIICDAGTTELSGGLDSYIKESESFDYSAKDGAKYTAAATDSPSGELRLIKLLPQSRIFMSIKTQQMLFLLLLLVAVVAYVYCAARLWRDIHKPLKTLVSAFGAVKHGDLSTRIHHDRNDEFADIYKSFNHMSGRLESLIEQMYKQKIRTQQAELKQLQSQINPHFLYNSFFMIKAFSRMGDCDSIERITDGLGEYFRYVTRNGEDEVYLEQEVKHAKSYTSVQDMRFSTRISLDFPDAPEEIAKTRVPRLIFQPLMENAYSHGLSQITDKGTLRVSYSYDDEFARISVEDSGSGLDDEGLEKLKKQLTDPEPAETTGLINIHRRLRLRFGEPCGLSLSRSELGGLKVTMTVKRGENGK